MTFRLTYLLKVSFLVALLTQYGCAYGIYKRFSIKRPLPKGTKIGVLILSPDTAVGVRVSGWMGEEVREIADIEEFIEDLFISKLIEKGYSVSASLVMNKIADQIILDIPLKFSTLISKVVDDVEVNNVRMKIKTKKMDEKEFSEILKRVITQHQKEKMATLKDAILEDYNVLVTKENTIVNILSNLWSVNYILLIKNVKAGSTNYIYVKGINTAAKEVEYVHIFGLYGSQILSQIAWQDIVNEVVSVISGEKK